MAFVYRNQRRSKVQCSPGPGGYQILSPASNKANYTVSFNDKRTRQLWNIKESPGPGDYDVPSNFSKNKIILDDREQNLMILESQQCSGFFKSQTKRGTYQKNSNTPGPGEYEVKLNKKANRFHKLTKPTKLMKYLYQKNVRKNTSSIPDVKIEEYEQMEERKRDDESKIVKIKSKSKKTCAFASKVQREVLERPKTSVGPGSYNIGHSDFYLRAHNQVKGKNSLHSSNPKKKNHCHDLNIKQSQLGPGFYDIQKTAFDNKVASYSKGIQCFGSKENRFWEPIIDKNPDVGPATYENKQNWKEKSDKLKKNVPFGCGSVKEFNLANNLNRNLSPFTYNPKVCIKGQADNIRKLNHEKISFGSSAARFRQQKKLKKGKSINDEQQNLKEKYQKLKKKKMKNISKNKNRKQKHNIEDSRPVCYDNEYHTMEKKYCRKSQINAPFFTCSQRFQSGIQNKETLNEYLSTGKIKIQAIQDDIQCKKQNLNKKRKRSQQRSTIIKKYFEECLKNSKNEFQKSKASFLQGDKRNDIFDKKQQCSLSGKKKSFNKLFADTIIL